MAGQRASADSALLGARIRQYRALRRMSLRELSAAAGTSPGFLSQFERGHVNASIATLRRLTDCLGLTIADLFDEEAGTLPRVVQATERTVLNMGEGARKQLISPRPLQNVEVYLVDLDPLAHTGPERYVHGDSQEICLVLSGEVCFDIDGTDHHLGTGGSIEFRSSTPHRVVNNSMAPASVLWIISPPSHSLMTPHRPDDNEEEE
jgi:transcriptional regulator with XRE-family HTH domain